MKYILISISLILLYNANIFSQTQVKGRIIDRSTKKAVPYASVAFLHTTTGTITDDNGKFFTDTKQPEIDSMIVSCLGYITDTFAINPNKFQEVKFGISPQSYNIEEIVVVPGENPAHVLLRKVIKHKKFNNPSKLNSYSYESYTKMQLDLNNFDSEIKDVNYMKKFSIAFDGIDTASNGKVYMPIFFTENISDYYYQKRPKKQKEYIKAVNVSGVENESASRYTGGMYTEINFYENYIDLFEKQFVSPIAYNGLLVYKYYLTDSAFIENTWCKQITFRPRRKYEYTFEGDFWVADSCYSLKKIYSKVSNHVNIDFVMDLYIKQSFERINDSTFFPQQEEIFADFNIADKTAGFFARKFSSRKKIKINPHFPENFFSLSLKREIIVADKAKNKNSNYWNTSRHTSLSQKEENIYRMTDSIQNVPAFKVLRNIMMTSATGFWPGKYFEFGPVFEIYTFNESEGRRIQLGGRTSNKFSKFIELNAHAAYGFKDQAFKYGSLIKLKLQKTPHTLFSASYDNDMIPLGLSFIGYSSDLFSSALARTPNDNLLFEKSLTAELERDITVGIFYRIFANHQIISPSVTVPFVNNTGEQAGNLNVFETGITAHIGFNEEYMEAVFNRVSLGSIYPITEITYTAGIPSVMGSNYKYSKLNFHLTHRLYFGPFGKFKYDIEAGKIFGTVPFPLLKLFNGNESYVLQEQAFNLMNVYEFAADEYMSVFLAQHFQGMFLNRIPLLRRLKWREVLFFRAAIGNLSDANRNEFQFPGTLNDVNDPYMETGVGIENIFNFFRVDAVWRLSHLQNENISKFGIRVGLYAAF